MNCPNCESQTSADQQFCRECGAGLADGEKRSFNPRPWAFAVLFSVFGGLIVAMTGDMLKIRWLAFTGLFIMIGGMFLVAAYGLMRQTRPRKRKPAQPSRPATVERADTTNKLLPIGANDDYIPSVVDATTNLLKTPAPNRSTSTD